MDKHKFSFLKHQSDIRLKVEAKDLTGLFQAALEGMNHIIKGSNLLNDPVSEKLVIELESLDTTALLIDFLSDILCETQTEHAIYDVIDSLEIEDTKLKAVLKGRRIEGFKTDIKAVTYHEAEIKINEKGNYESVIVFDL